MSRSKLLTPATGWTRFAALALFFAATIAARPASAAAESRLTIPDENTPVIDRAGLLDGATQRQLIGWLHELREKTHAQVKVLTVPSLQGEDIFAFAERHYELWKLGQKGVGNGALIVLAPKEHAVRIHVGRGLEGVLPDSWCGTTSSQIAKLYFAKGQYAQGLTQLVQAVAGRIAADAGVKLTGVANEPLQLGGGQSDGNGLMVFFVVFFIMIIAVIVIGQMQRRQQARWGHHASGWGQNNFPSMPGGMWGIGGGDFGGGSGGWSSGGSDFGGGGDTAGGGGGASW